MKTEVSETSKLQAAITERDMTPEALCAAIDKHTNGFIRVTVFSVGRWLAGHKPRPETQRAIAEVLDTTVADLFGES